jgi:hypothetical protein
MRGGPIGNRGRCIDWRRQFRSVTSRIAVTASGAPQKPSNSSDVRDTGLASDAERPEGASGGFYRTGRVGGRSRIGCSHVGRRRRLSGPGQPTSTTE